MHRAAFAENGARVKLQGSTGVADAVSTLADYDSQHRSLVTQVTSQGGDGALAGNTWAKDSDRPSLSASIRALVAAANATGGRVMLGICSDDASSGLAILKAWTRRLDLPRGLLHGMDDGGVPLDMRDFGAVYIKYNSHPVDGVERGTAMISSYGGDFRGVYFSPELEQGGFHQYAVLPSDLFNVDA